LFLCDYNDRDRIPVIRGDQPVVITQEQERYTYLAGGLNGLPLLLMYCPPETKHSEEGGEIEVYHFQTETRTLQHVRNLNLPVIDEKVLRAQLGLMVSMGEQTYDVANVLYLEEETCLLIGRTSIARIVSIAEPKMYKISFSILFDGEGRHEPLFIDPSADSSDLGGDYCYDEENRSLSRIWTTDPGEPRLFKGWERLYYARFRPSCGWDKRIKLFSRRADRARDIHLVATWFAEEGGAPLVAWLDNDEKPRLCSARVYPDKRRVKESTHVELPGAYARGSLRVQRTPEGLPACLLRIGGAWRRYAYDNDEWKWLWWE